MSGARQLRPAWRRAALAGVPVLAALAGCGGAAREPSLPAAGGTYDDGAGQLAQASIELRLDEGFDIRADAARAPIPRRYTRTRPGAWTPGSGVDPALAGSVYGLDGAMGGGVYGFVVGGGGFGIVGPSLPPRGDGGAGAVLGALTWRGDRGVAWPAACAGARVAKAGGPVAGAVVYLASAPLRRERDDDERWTATRTAIVADGCALWPAAQPIGPLPGLVELENGGGGPLTVSAGRAGAATIEPGGRWTMAVGDTAPLRLDAGDRAPAWLLGQAHDFATVTDALGRFALDEVPDGTYELVVWYPPLVRAVEGGRPVWTAATSVRRSITVGRTGAVRLSLALDPAP